MKRFLLAALTALWLSPAGLGAEELPADLPRDSLARVGDQVIGFSELNTLLNSAAVVGLSVPALGTTERNEVMVGLLDKAISVNLLYLDAVRNGKDRDASYQEDLRAFSDGILSGLYRSRALVGDIEVTQEEIDAYYKERIAPGTEMTDRLRAAVEASIHKEKFKQRTANMRARLREGIEIRLYPEKLNPAQDATRPETEIIADYGHGVLTWGQARGHLGTSDAAAYLPGRVELLDRLIDEALMAQKGREMGLDKDPVYLARTAEFRKTRLVNRHRSELVRSMEPDQQDLRDYYERNRNNIVFNEQRKILMVVIDSKEDAEAVKARIDSGEISIYQAAAEYSTHPNAKKDLGDFGWVSRGSGFSALDELTFALAPGEVGGPVKSPAGWHLVKVVDVRDARYTDPEDGETRKVTRRLLLKDRLNDYVVNLRKNEFPVVVYDDNMRRLFREEAQWIAEKTRQMEANPERAQHILDEMRQLSQ